MRIDFGMTCPRVVLLCALLLEVTSALRVLPSVPLHHISRSTSCFHVSCAIEDSEAEEEARRQAALDAPSEGEDELMKEFNKRLEAEGGALQFKLRTDAKRVAEGVQAGADRVKDATQDAADSAASAANRLPPNLLPIISVMIFLSVLPPLLVSLFG
uniref:Uncharacterized protein n=1 Tax=Calcidiscus leptoporus TaxID=127549 RepID=A0A7S0NUY9_9EUKA|mmetsp:Transcript_25510/g.59486  ORF Transcript_25510/g.59486 Transcript_25510/m.59486 type:complete len:157 (+) Transcript_25510:83-553(+)